MKNPLFTAGRLLILIISAFSFVLSSCASAPGNYQRIIRNAYSGAASTDKLNGELIKRAMTAGALASTADYRIGPGDLLEISVFQVDELKTTARVSRAGEIDLPLINGVKAVGLTTAGLASAIELKLGVYLENPVVTVFVKQYRSQRITVLGAVKSPQVFTVSGQKYLLDMLSMAGGLSGDASNLCIVQKKGSACGKPEIIKIDLKKLLVDGRADLNIPLSSGDVVSVPEAGRFFVDGAVGGPGSFQLKGSTTLTQAISMAKGLNFEAIKKIKIYRDAGDGRRRLIVANYDSILDGKSPDIYIRDKDVIFVPRSELKALLKGIRGTVFTSSVAVGREGY